MKDKTEGDRVLLISIRKTRNCFLEKTGKADRLSNTEEQERGKTGDITVNYVDNERYPGNSIILHANWATSVKQTTRQLSGKAQITITYPV